MIYQNINIGIQVLRFFKSLLFLLLLIIATLVISPRFVKWDPYKQTAINLFNKQTGYNLTVDGDIVCKFFPQLTVSLKSVTLVGSKADASMAMAAKELIIFLNPLQIINKKYIVKSIAIVEGNISLNNFAQDNLAQTAIKNITLTNSQISYLKNNINIIDNFKVQELTVKASDNNVKLHFSKYFNDSQELINLSAIIDAKSNQITNGKISGQAIDASFEASATQVDNSYQLNGKITGDIGNFNKFAKYIAKALDLAAPASKEKVSFNSDFMISSQTTNFNNLVIDSNSIKAQGDIFINIKQKPIIDLNLTFTKLDIDGLYQDDSKTKLELNKEQAQDKLINALENDNKSFTISKNFDLLASLEIANLTHNSANINKSSISFAFNNGLMDLYYANFIFNDTNNLMFSGAITANEYRPIFNGEINIKSDDIESVSSFLGMDLLKDLDLFKGSAVVFYANIALTPKQIIFSDIFTSINNTPIAADINIMLGQERLQVFLNFNMDQLDLDTVKIIDLATIFNNNLFSSDDVIKNISWLRSINADVTLGFNVNKLNYQKNLWQNLSGYFIVSSGVLKIEDLTINNTNNHYTINSLIDARSLTPKLNIDIAGDLLTMSNNYLAQDNKIQLFPLDLFDGRITLNLNKLTLGSLNALNVTSNISMQNQLVQIDNLKADVFDGSFNTQGSISISNPSIALSFTFANITAAKLFSYFPYANNISALLSLSGSIASSGTSLDVKEWLANTQAAISLTSGNVNITGFDLNALVRGYAIGNNADKADLTTELASFLSNGNSRFNNLGGNVTISQGILQMQNFSFSNEILSGAFTGNIDLASGLCNSYTTLAFIAIPFAPQTNLAIKTEGNINEELTKTINRVSAK
jgi:uncharacterized protein involved in outer membrane biogenesis